MRAVVIPAAVLEVQSSTRGCRIPPGRDGPQAASGHEHDRPVHRQPNPRPRRDHAEIAVSAIDGRRSSQDF